MKNNIKDLKSKTIVELEKQKNALFEEIAKMKSSEKAVPQKDTNLLMKKRKQLAVLLTIISEKELIEELKK